MREISRKYYIIHEWYTRIVESVTKVVSNGCTVPLLASLETVPKTHIKLSIGVYTCQTTITDSRRDCHNA